MYFRESCKNTYKTSSIDIMFTNRTTSPKFSRDTDSTRWILNVAIQLQIPLTL